MKHDLNKYIFFMIKIDIYLIINVSNFNPIRNYFPMLNITNKVLSADTIEKSGIAIKC